MKTKRLILALLIAFGFSLSSCYVEEHSYHHGWHHHHQDGAEVIIR